MPRQTTYETDNELQAVYAILMAIGQAPVSKLYDQEGEDFNFINPEISFIYNILQEVNRDVQNEGWVFNREDHYPLCPDCNGHIKLPNNVLRMDVTHGQIYRTSDVVRREGKLYDKLHHSYIWGCCVSMDITWLLPYDDLPPVFKRYIVHRASGRAATQLVSNSELTKLIGTQEAQARAACIEYECNQGDYTYFGTPHHTMYQSFQPYRSLMR